MIIKEIFSKFKDNSWTNCTFLEFQEFSRTKVIFKDFSRSVRTLRMDGWMEMTCSFTSFSTVFQSYQEDEQMIMKGLSNGSPV